MTEDELMVEWLSTRYVSLKTELRKAEVPLSESWERRVRMIKAADLDRFVNERTTSKWNSIVFLAPSPERVRLREKVVEWMIGL